MLVYEPYYRQKRTIRVPPIPPTYALTDRATGAIWYLKVDSSDSTLELCTASQLAPLDAKTAVVYPSYNEPMLSSTQRIYVSNGSATVETAKPNGVNSQPLLLKALGNDLLWWLVTIVDGAITLTSQDSTPAYSPLV